jgi:malate dehydrogenase (oxaloacetate-decarboxylating)
MMDFKAVLDKASGELVVDLPCTGAALLDCPLLNKGSAFTEQERREFGLTGLLPPHVGSIEEQVARRYAEYVNKATDLERHVFLRDLQDRNETLFYRLLREHIVEMMPVIYTPVVGAACQQFSLIYRKPRGLFIPFPEQGAIDSILGHRPYQDVDIIVVTDGERILGLGDLGVGGMGIPVGKLSLYTLCGGIHPARTLPIFLDVGTDNEDKLRDPLYLGWRHERVRGPRYDAFIEAFVAALNRRLPHVLLQWEDFAQRNARPLLYRYRDRICSFNDDIQGTAAVTLGALLAAVGALGSRLGDQRIVIVGAGSAGTGIRDLVVEALVREGLTEAQARERFWFVDRNGLLHTGLEGLTPFQQSYGVPQERVATWQRGPGGEIGLLEVVKRVRPTVLIGVTGQPGSFTEEVVRAMTAGVERPIIFPLSNPTSRSEAVPVDLVGWTEGRALVATGSPFGDVIYRGRRVPVNQCNNSYIFPGVGLGVVASRANRVTDGMILAAARALAECAPIAANPEGALLPPLTNIRAVSRRIALAVGEEAQRQGLAEPLSPEEWQYRVDATWWTPRYPLMHLKHAPPLR